MTHPFQLEFSDATRRGFAELRRLAWRERESILFGLTALALTDLCQLMMPQVLGNGVSAMFAPRPAGETPAEFVAAKLVPVLWKIAGLAVVVALFRYLWRHFFFRMARRVERDLRARIYDHLLSQPPEFYSRHRTGDLMSLLISDLEAVRMTLAIGLVTATDALLYTSFALLAILLIAPKIALICLLPFPFIIAAVLFFDGRIEQRYEAQQSQISKLTERVREGLSGVRTIKAYLRERDETARLMDENRRLIDRTMALTRLQALFMPMITALSGCSLALLIGFGLPAALRGELGYGDLVKFVAYLGMLSWPMMAIGWTVTLVVRGCVSMDRINRLLAEAPAIRDGDGLAAPPGGPLTLAVDNLGFRYPGSERAALEGISFTLEPGKQLGIVGQIGSGKSTLVSLLLRERDPGAGSITLGGRPLAEWPLDALRAAMIPVPQEAFLFSLTLRENILLGREGDAEAAARDAALETGPGELPQGMDTLVGERGVTVSGGQRQRAALARALLAPPGILLIDDTLSAVDAGTEAKLIARLRERLAGRAAVIVAHRLSAVAHCDEILVLEGGKITQRGTHAELLAREGLYRSLARLQRHLHELPETA